MPRVLFILTTLFPLPLTAQSWQPIYPGEHANYQRTTADFVTHTLWIDSITVDSEEVTHLNRVVTDCTDCLDMYSKRINQPQFLGLRLRDLGDGLFRSEGSDTFLIATRAEVNDSWMWNPSAGIEATLLDKTESLVLGEVDSLKTALLSDGRTIRWSKSHGLTCFEDTAGVAYELKGIEERGLGVILPKFEDFFDWPVGAVFQYYRTVPNPDIPIDCREKWTVLHKEAYPDSFIYSVHRIGNCYSAFEESRVVKFHRKGFAWTNAYPGQLLLREPDQEFTFAPYYQSLTLGAGFDGSLAKIAGEADLWFSPSLVLVLSLLEDDVLIPYEPDCCGAVFQQQRATPGLGLDLSLKHHFEISLFIELLGYVIDGDTVGTVYSDQQLIPTEEVPGGQPGLRLSPNPVVDRLYVEWDSPPPKKSQLECYDPFGRIIFSQPVPVGATEEVVSLYGLPPGAYLLQLRSPDWRLSRRFIKME